MILFSELKKMKEKGQGLQIMNSVWCCSRVSYRQFWELLADASAAEDDVKLLLKSLGLWLVKCWISAVGRKWHCKVAARVRLILEGRNLDLEEYLYDHALVTSREIRKRKILLSMKLGNVSWMLLGTSGFSIYSKNSWTGQFRG